MLMDESKPKSWRMFLAGLFIGLVIGVSVSYANGYLHGYQYGRSKTPEIIRAMNLDKASYDSARRVCDRAVVMCGKMEKKQ